MLNTLFKFSIEMHVARREMLFIVEGDASGMYLIAEGLRLAEVSGGQYYSITQLSQIQSAYDDIVRQLRTAYSVTYRSTLAETNEKTASPRLKIKVKRDNAFVKVNSVAVVSESK